MSVRSVAKRVGAVAVLLDRHEPTKLPIAAAHGEPSENVEAERLADVPALLVLVVATDVARHAGKEVAPMRTRANGREVLSKCSRSPLSHAGHCERTSTFMRQLSPWGFRTSRPRMGGLA
jgi:hypothetical protein